MKLGIFRLIFLLLPAPMFAQVDTVIYLDPVEIKEISGNTVSEYGSQKNISESTLEKIPGKELSAIIRSQTTWFIRSYGVTGIASISAKGASASQNMVLWNGVPVNNPMLGQVDLNLLNLFHTKHIRFSQNDPGSSAGYGTIGAVLDIRDRRSEDQVNNWEFYGKLASFKNHTTSLSYTAKIRSIEIGNTLYFDQGQNNFPYKSEGTEEKKYISHSAHATRGFRQSYYLSKRKNQNSSLHLWLQRTYREIPPTTTQNTSAAEQWDGLGRFVFNHDILHKSTMIHFTAAWMDEFLRYRDIDLQQDDKSHFRRGYFEGKVKNIFSSIHSLDVSLRLSYDMAVAPAYNQSRSALHQQFQVTYSGELGGHHIIASLAEQSISGKNFQYIPALSLIKHWNSIISTNLLLQRNIRNPTLNDRYWVPGGNPDLKSEHGWTEAFQLIFKGNPKDQGRSTRLSAEVFHRYIKDWILWAAIDNSPFFHTSNIAAIRSFGAELKASYGYKIKEGKLDFDLGYSFVRSRNEVSIKIPSIEEGQQLYYIPKHQMRLNMEYSSKHWYTGMFYAYTDKSKGINEVLPAYFTMDLYINKIVNIKKTKTRIGFYIQNLTDTQYRLVERRPMPGRNLGISFKTGNL
jgi:vitamin B12 transporter